MVKRKIARFIYWLYLKTLNKKKWIEGCEIVFNLDGHNYYRYKDSGKIPLKRQEQLQQLVIMLEKRFDDKEFSELIEITQGYHQQAMDSLTLKHKMDGLQNAIYAVAELKSRKEDLIFHPHLMMQIAATSLIRDNEDPGAINPLLTSEKVTLFESKFLENEIGFFLQSGLTELLPNKEELMQESVRQLELIQNLQKQYNLTREIISKKQKAYATILGEMKSTNSAKN